MSLIRGFKPGLMILTLVLPIAVGCSAPTGPTPNPYEGAGGAMVDDEPISLDVSAASDSVSTQDD